jgi:hypothetical protein
MTRLNRWQDLLNAALGVWLVASPWLMNFDDGGVAMWNAVIAGVLLAGLAFGAFFVPRAWEDWAQAIVALWLVASPWVLGFSKSEVPMLNALWVGVAVLALASWALLANKAQGTSQPSPTKMAH